MFTRTQYYLFSDASVSCQKELAIGAFLLLSHEKLKQFEYFSREELEKRISQEIIYKKIQTKRSTYAEMLTVKSALDYAKLSLEPQATIHIYTDCENLCYLLGERKNKLIQSEFKSQAGKELKNKDIYIELFKKSQFFKLLTHKIKGHCKEKYKTSLEAKIFSFIDKKARSKMRLLVENYQKESCYVS